MVSFLEAKKLTLAYYVEIRNGLPLPLRDAPRKVVKNVPLSVNSIIAHIESNSDIGVWLVSEYAGGMGLTIE